MLRKKKKGAHPFHKEHEKGSASARGKFVQKKLPRRMIASPTKKCQGIKTHKHPMEASLSWSGEGDYDFLTRDLRGENPQNTHQFARGGKFVGEKRVSPAKLSGYFFQHTGSADAH